MRDTQLVTTFTVQTPRSRQIRRLRAAGATVALAAVIALPNPTHTRWWTDRHTDRDAVIVSRAAHCSPDADGC